MSELESLLDELEQMGFWSIDFWRHQDGKYQIKWGHNRISWVDLDPIKGFETREDGLRQLKKEAAKLLATDHQFGDKLSNRRRHL